MCTDYSLTRLRAAYLATLGARSTGEDHAQRVDSALDEIAAALESALAIDRLLTLAPATDEGRGEGPWATA